MFSLNSSNYSMLDSRFNKVKRMAELPGHRENREFDCSFFHREFAKNLKNMLLHLYTI